MDNKDAAQEQMIEELWRSLMVDGPSVGTKRQQRFFRSLPAEERCKVCHAPFDGPSGALVKTVFRKYPSQYNHFYCSLCDEFARQYQGGAEVPITMLFADIRGSTTLGEQIDSRALSELINRFYIKSTHVLCQAGAMIEKLAGDEVTALFVPGLAGEGYQRQAIEAAQKLLRVTGHADKKGPWAPIGIGIHSGQAFVGSVGNPNGITDVAALGDVPNTASRLTSLAAAGEILVSEDTLIAAGLDDQDLERRHLELKGRSEGIDAIVLHL